MKSILCNAKKLLWLPLIVFIIAFLCGWMHMEASAASPKSKFYDFSEQLIDGQIKKPTALYTDARQKVKFERLLRLKKSFLQSLYNTSKEKVFK